MDVLDTINRRISVRAFEPTCLSSDQLDHVRIAAENAPSLTSAELRVLVFADGSVVKNAMGGVMGDYGKVIVAPHFIVLAAKHCRGYLVDAGYRFEHLVLFATSQGLGTCWIGGMFRSQKMHEQLGISNEWEILALTPVGRPATVGAKGWLDRTTRQLLKSANRMPIDELVSWNQGEALPDVLRQNNSLMRWLDAIRRAPSWANKQPWRMSLDRTGLTIFKHGSQVKEGKDYHVLDCGIAMAHASLAGEALGLTGTWTLMDCEGGSSSPCSIARYAFSVPIEGA